MITIGEISPGVKNRVVELFDNDAQRGVMNPKTLRVVVTGLALQALNKKYNGAFGDGISGANPEDLFTDEQALELVTDRQENLRGYLQLARDIYVEATIRDVTSTFGEEVGKLATEALNSLRVTSSPDATGNDLDVEAAADSVVPGTPGKVCPICQTVHD